MYGVWFIIFVVILVVGAPVALAYDDARIRKLSQYALVLIFVAIAVVVFLMLQDPIIEGPFSTINKSLTGV